MSKKGDGSDRAKHLWITDREPEALDGNGSSATVGAENGE